MRFRKQFLALGFLEKPPRIHADCHGSDFKKMNAVVFIRENPWRILFCHLLRLGDNAQVRLG